MTVITVASFGLLKIELRNSDSFIKSLLIEGTTVFEIERVLLKSASNPFRVSIKAVSNQKSGLSTGGKVLG